MEENEKTTRSNKISVWFRFVKEGEMGYTSFKLPIRIVWNQTGGRIFVFVLTIRFSTLDGAKNVQSD